MPTPPRALAAAVAALAAAVALAAAPAAAPASTAGIIAPSDPLDPKVDSGWQAGTCNAEPPVAAQPCSVATPGQFYETAAGHPQWGFTQFIVRHETTLELLKIPVGEPKTLRVDLPAGLTVNPGATPRCPLAAFQAGAGNCPAASRVGTSAVTLSLLGVPTPPLDGLTRVPVYNLVPRFGEPALFGFELAGNEVYLEPDVAWDSDYHEGFTIQVPRVADLEPLIKGLILQNRLVFDGRAGDGTFLTLPSTCLGEAFPGPSGHAYSTWLRAVSWVEAAQPGYVFPRDAEPPFESPIPPGTEPKGCATIPYDPELEVDPGTDAADSPAGAVVEARVPHLLPGSGGGEQDSSHTRTAAVTLPAGMGLNPAAAQGLAACTDAEFGKGTRAPVACPPASRIGSVTVATPPLPEGDLEGEAYVGEQLGRDPASGDVYRVFIHARSERYGISARLVGRVAADPRTGRLTTTIDEVPQVPFASFRLDLDGGPRAALSSPPVCGPNESVARMVPWSGGPAAAPSSSFALAVAPGGGPCAPTLAARPFAPGFAAGPDDAGAGAFSPLTLAVSRGDGEQELKAIDVRLAPGMSAALKGVPYCPEEAIASAAGRSGREERRAPSCPAASRVGGAAVLAGTGPSPLRLEGDVHLAGPYRGAPLSLAVVTPAVAGPYDLGTVVVRVALHVDPRSALVRAVSDPIPDVHGGARLSLRRIEARLDRERFTVNPTSCGPLAVEGELSGGGADPAEPAAWSRAAVAAPLRPLGCERLGFRPRLQLRLSGRMKRGKNPRLRAIVRARPGDAGIARAAVTLPRSLFLDQASLARVCTRVQFAAGSCPRRSVYGRARAFSPLLDRPLEGPVYLRSSDNPLPDLVAHLRGQVTIELVGRVEGRRGRIRTTFEGVPDVPVSRFELVLPGGRRGLLVASRDLCRRGAAAFAAFRAHNGKRVARRVPLRVPCVKKRAAGKKGARRG